MKKMTREDVKEMLRKIIEFEINRAIEKNKILGRGQIKDLVSDIFDNSNKFVKEDDVSDKIQDELDDWYFSDKIQNMLVDEDKVSDIVSDKIGEAIDDKVGSVESDVGDLEIKTDRMERDISETEKNISDLDNRLEKIEYEIKNLAKQIKKGG